MSKLKTKRVKVSRTSAKKKVSQKKVLVPTQYTSQISINDQEQILWNGKHIGNVFDGEEIELYVDNNSLQVNHLTPQEIAEVLAFEDKIREELGRFFTQSQSVDYFD